MREEQKVSSGEATAHTHVDEWLEEFMQEQGSPNLGYAKFVIGHMRQPAVVRMRHDPHMKGFKLFCMYQGKKWRVTMASRLGDIGITEDFTRDSGYEQRIFVDEVESWHTAP